MAEATQRYGVIVLAKSEPRLLRATLASLGAQSCPPVCIAVAVTPAREHMLADLPHVAGTSEVARVVAPEEEMIAAAVSAIAPRADIALVVPAGVALDKDYLSALCERTERFEDIVAAIDLVHGAAKLDADAQSDLADRDLLGAAHEWPIVSLARAAVAARSLLGAIFWARVAALSQIPFGPVSDVGEALAFALALNQMRTRGRTEVRFTQRARGLRLVPERRTGFDAGYGLYRKLCQLAEAGETVSLLREPAPAHFDLRLERLRLFAGQGLRALVSPANRKHAVTFLKGAMAAHHDMRALRRTVRRDLREMR
jgi:hypothetical protein